MNYPHSTAPKQARHPLDASQREVRAIFQVVDAQDNVIDSFRNEAIAKRLAATDPTYSVRGFSLV